jgi:hypothetical protein
VSVERPEKKPEKHSLAWIKGIVTKARKSGATDDELFDALFPECKSREAFEALKSAALDAKKAIDTDEIDSDEAGRLFGVFVRARRDLMVKLRGA